MTDTVMLLYKAWSSTKNRDTVNCKQRILDHANDDSIRHALGKPEEGFPVDLAYTEAIGLAFHHFAYLEWVLLSILAKMKRAGYTHITNSKTAGCLARALREAIAAATPVLGRDLVQALDQFHRGFVAAKHRRDRLFDWHPFTGPQSATDQHCWPTDKANAAAAQFAEAAIEGRRILNALEECLARGIFDAQPGESGTDVVHCE